MRRIVAGIDSGRTCSLAWIQDKLQKMDEADIDMVSEPVQ